ncbi:MAG: hypothetical protein ABFD89_15475 [Bryobacteraceae bacterium]
MPKLTLADIHTELSSFVAAHDVSVKALDAKLDGITARLDRLNGKVAEHERFVTAHETEKQVQQQFKQTISAKTMVLITAAMLLCSIVTAWATVVIEHP